MLRLILYVRYTIYLISFFDSFVEGLIGVHIDSSLSDGCHRSRFLAGSWSTKRVCISFKHRIIYTDNFSLDGHIIEKNKFSLS